MKKLPLASVVPYLKYYKGSLAAFARTAHLPVSQIQYAAKLLKAGFSVKKLQSRIMHGRPMKIRPKHFKALAQLL